VERLRRLLITLIALVVYNTLSFGSAAQQFDPALFSGMRWRLVGPFRGGRVLAVSGVRGQPNIFYFGAVGGGVWKTNDAGRVWAPIFDRQPVASIGAIAVAPANANIIYVGTGEADMRSDITYGNGVYKSSDAGRTWTFLGLRDTRQIGRILVHPKDSNVVFVAALGHSYGPNKERGVFRSRDGGKSWEAILFKDENTGAIDLVFDPQNPQIMYAALWQTRRPPWSVYPPSNGPGSGLYKSTDGGDHWQQLTGHGLPSEGLGRIGIAVAPTDSKRIYLILDAKEGGLYRSDDAGQNWARTDSESRIWGRGWYFGDIAVDTKDPHTVYVSNTSLYRSRDAGKTFTAIKGAPGGDDYHQLWIDRDDPQRMILGSDQGAIVTFNGAQTWSSWYNQPTGQFYHVITDNRFPYWLYGAQQDSGAMAIPSRGPFRTISFHDWHPIEGGGESGYIAPDPLNPEILFGGAVARYNLATHQDQSIPPKLAHPGEYRNEWTLPLVFSPLDPHELYFGAQVLFRTATGGQSWQIISPDLTRDDAGVPSTLDASAAANGPKGKHRGVIYTIAPSPLRSGEIWIGTDDGLIQVTRDDGKTWQNATPSQLTPWSKVTQLEASRHDAKVIYAAIDRHRLDDLQPYIYRTRDGGKSWQLINRGIPEGSYVNTIREDPVREGLLFAGTETGVFISFHDGDAWQPLQLNLPNASIRDLVIHENDLVAATHGRGFWILDDITPLRQLTPQVAKVGEFLFDPQTAWRIRPGSDEGTPLPLDEPTGENPPSGALINYFLKSSSATPVTLEILDAAGQSIRHYSSADSPPKIDPQTLDIPAYWIHQSEPLSSDAGMHRFLWDLHYEGVAGLHARRSGTNLGPWALPGNYTVKLTAADHTYSQRLTLKMDPNVKSSHEELVKNFETAREITAALTGITQAANDLDHLLTQLKSLQKEAQASSQLAIFMAALERKAQAIRGELVNDAWSGVGESVPSSDQTSLRYLSASLIELARIVESADVAPAPDALTAWARLQPIVQGTLAKWDEIKSRDIPRLNQLTERQAKR
jgi:photosystem II stability/assembly factor-like uncharacterized protein